MHNTKTAEGKIKDTHLTYRQYLCDSAFAAVLSGNGISPARHCRIRQTARAITAECSGRYLISISDLMSQDRAGYRAYPSAKAVAIAKLVSQKPAQRATDHDRERVVR